MAKPDAIIADDEEQLRIHLRSKLAALWPELDICGEAANGLQALELIESCRPAIAFLDIKMPGLSGIDTLREIKKMKPLTEVIMLTGNATVETGIEGMKLGALDYLMKPCNTEELVDKIHMAKERKYEHEERIREAKAKRIATSPWSVLRGE